MLPVHEFYKVRERYVICLPCTVSSITGLRKFLTLILAQNFRPIYALTLRLGRNMVDV